MIKNIEDLKHIQIVCRRNKQDVENCLNLLEELGFKVINYDNKYRVISFSSYDNMFKNDIRLECEKDTYFFNKKFIKILKKLINEEKKEKVEDFEIASDGRIIAINNLKSEQKVYTIYGTETDLYHLGFVNEMISLGSLYATAEARDKAKFKMEIETKLKNIAERLNKGQKIDWDEERPYKYSIFYDFKNYALCQSYATRQKDVGQIYCLDAIFLNVAKKEIGEENLIKYFKE